MALTSVPERVRLRLWGKAGGRCEYEGCNQRLWLDDLTKVEFNVAYIAHIVADGTEGPRGDPKLSKLLSADITNLMLLCDQHHRLIDKEQVREHPVERLVAMKRSHEERIELLGSLTEEKRSHVLMYGANIGSQSAPLSFKKVVQAMLPNWYPAESQPLEIGLRNSSLIDRSHRYWELERLHLEAKFSQQVRPRLAQGHVNHFSVFALAPQPLLVLLGSLLSDIPAAEVYQLHREPPDWRWQEPLGTPSYKFREPTEIHGPAALVFSLSASVADERIRSVLPEASIWSVYLDEPHNDFLKSRRQAEEFRVLMRRVMDRIKLRHQNGGEIHVFPAMPVCLSVELGRIQMPKADMPLKIYDQNRETNGFHFALDVGQQLS